MKKSHELWIVITANKGAILFAPGFQIPLTVPQVIPRILCLLDD
jgi:hypothetical protein